MPLSEEQEREVKYRLNAMFMDTIKTFELISKNTDIFGENSTLIREAIDEYLMDFIYQPDGLEIKHPEALIFEASRVELQSSGFYGAQLNLKEAQVTAANNSLREAISGNVSGIFRKSFKKWIGVINNFLGSLGVTGVGEALKEVKDCLRDELPDE